MSLVCVHIIAKETTNFGSLMFRSCLDSMKDYADEIVVIDNGCSEDIVKMVKEYNVNYHRDEGTNFKDLRNSALDKMELKDPECFIHWIDTDEVYFSSTLLHLKSQLDPNHSTVTTQLVHFMIDPDKYQYLEKKRNIYKWHPGLRWVGDVHENITNVAPGKSIDTNLNYLHFGYCREQWKTFLKWLFYDTLQFNHVDRYKDERLEDGTTVPYLRDWRTPDTIIEDRRPETKQYVGNYPVEMSEWFQAWQNSGKEWREYLEEINGEDPLWEYWKKLYEEKGNWRDTLEPVCVNMGWL